MALTAIITNAGRAALVNAANTGTAPVTITQVGLTATAITPDATTAALTGEHKRVATISGDVVADDTIHLIVRDESADAFTVRGFALYLADGTLFAIYGQAGVILEKSAQAMMLLAIDIQFADVDADLLTFGDTNFLNPPATTETQGVVELATEAEATTGVDTVRAVTPKGLKTAVTSWLNTRFGDGAPSAFVKGLLTAASAAALRLSLELKGAALKDEGAGNGLDSDLLDGQHGSYYTNIPSRLGYVPWGPSNDGAGSGLDADLLDGQDGGYYSNIVARLGYNPANRAGDTFTGPVNVANAGNASIAVNSSGVVVGSLTAQGDGNLVLYRNTGGGDAPIFSVGSQVGPFAVQMPITRQTFTVWDAGNDGAGSGLDADMLDGQHGSYYTNIVARLGYAPVNRSGDFMTGSLTIVHAGSPKITLNSDGVATASLVCQNDGNVVLYRGAGAGDVAIFAVNSQTGPFNINLPLTRQNLKVWDAGNDGAGSGLDADLLDGFHASDLLRIISESKAGSGYMQLSNGLLLQWGRWTSSPTPGAALNINFPVAFSAEPFTLVTMPVVTTSSGATTWSSDGITGASFPARCSIASIGCRYFAIGPV